MQTLCKVCETKKTPAHTKVYSNKWFVKKCFMPHSKRWALIEHFCWDNTLTFLRKLKRNNLDFGLNFWAVKAHTKLRCVVTNVKTGWRFHTHTHTHTHTHIYIYIYNVIRGSLNKFSDFFRMCTFIDSTHMKL